jgi:nucleotide-binding universal stress UspA family protein
MYRTLLVPLDGSPFGEQALPLALSLARRSGAKLELLHVMAPLATMHAEGPLYLDMRLFDHMRERQKAEIGHYFEGVITRLRAAGAKEVVTRLREGEIPSEIRRQAEESKPDLLLMTTHGRGAFARFWLGSVAHDLVRKAPCPMILTRPHDEIVDLAKDPGPKQLLVPLDGEPLAESILGPATALAKVTGATITLVRVLHPVFPTAYPALGGTVGEMAVTMVDQIQTIQDQLKKEATDYLDKKAAELRGQGFKVETRVDINEQPAAAILKDAGAPGVDMIALATHGRGALARLLLGSVADKVIRNSPVPVLVQHPTGE